MGLDYGKRLQQIARKKNLPGSDPVELSHVQSLLSSVCLVRCSLLRERVPSSLE